MADVPQLTAGICERINNIQDGEDLEPLYNSGPVVQVLSIKKVGQTTGTGAAAQDRYRVIVSDGEYFLQAMLATQINAQVESGELAKNSVVKVERFTCNPVGGDSSKRLLIILNLSVAGSLPQKIGTPVALQGPPGSEKPASNAGTPAPTAAPAPAPQPAAPAPAPQQHNANRPHVFPIEGLSPYSNNWTIRAKVKQKSDVRTWSNQKGEGKLFSITLVDESGEIKATAFNQTVDMFYDTLQEGKTYYISKARVNIAKRKFNNVNNDYELSLERSTLIEECLDAPNIMVHYNFVPLDQLVNHNANDFVDVLGIVKEIGECTTFQSKAGQTMTKRELTLVDRSGASVRMTLWGRQAEKFDSTGEPIIAWKSAKVGDFGGRSLSMVGSSSMEINPDIAEAHVLRGWYDAEGNAREFQPQSTVAFTGNNTAFNRSEIRFLDDVRNTELGQEKPEYFAARATIMHIKSDNIAYPACQTDRCSKKVIQEGDSWRCEKCDKSFDRPSYRYIMAMAVADHSGQAWFQGFNDVGNVIFNMSADQLIELKDRDEAQYNKVLENAVGTTYNFTCRAKMETYGDTSRVRYGVQRIFPLDYKEEGNYLKELLSSPWAQ